MILSPADLQSRLQKHDDAPVAIDNADLMNVIWPGVEAQVKHETGRLWESTVHTVWYDVAPGQRVLLLPDYPVTLLSSVQYVTDIAESGTKTLAAYSAGDYDLDAASGRITLRSGSFPAGPGMVKVVCTAGYTAEQLECSATPEIAYLKALLLKIIQREWAIDQDNKRHLRSHSYGDESATYNFDLTRDEERAIHHLRRHGHK